MNARDKRTFQNGVYRYYCAHGRDLPWRRNQTPYRVLVSEIMLQQTQVDRVVPKYHAFMRRFPSIRSLARAPQRDVLTLWQGLGYNRRARMLHQCAQTVVTEHGGRFPRSFNSLVQLPGVGPYTAGAVMAFAYNQAVPIIETNIRTVYLHHFFSERTQVSDSELVRCIEQTLDTVNPREWYAALMDYGAHLKRTHGNQNVRSRHYTKQSRFTGSDRQVRGAIVRILTEHNIRTKRQLRADVQGASDAQLVAQLAALANEGMITKKGRQYTLA